MVEAAAGASTSSQAEVFRADLVVVVVVVQRRGWVAFPRQASLSQKALMEDREQRTPEGQGAHETTVQVRVGRVEPLANQEPKAPDTTHKQDSFREQMVAVKAYPSTALHLSP